MSVEKPPEKPKSPWTTIRVRRELKNVIQEHATRLGIPMHKFIAKSITFFVEQERKPKLKRDLPLIDKVSWYITKLGMSVGRFKENPTEVNLEKLIETANEVSERMEVDTSWVVKAANDYIKRKDSESSMELNSALKNTVIMLINKLAEYEEVRGEEKTTE